MKRRRRNPFRPKRQRQVIGFYTDDKGRKRPITRYVTKRVDGVTVQRSARAWSIDEGKTAKKITDNPHEWVKKPNRMDLVNVDVSKEKSEEFLRKKRLREKKTLKDSMQKLDKNERFMFNIAKRKLHIEGGKINQVYYVPPDPYTGKAKATFYGTFKDKEGKKYSKIRVESPLTIGGSRGRRYDVEAK